MGARSNVIQRGTDKVYLSIVSSLDAATVIPVI